VKDEKNNNRKNNKKRMKMGKRLWIFLFFIVCALSGVPVWWTSTKIYRADLPFEQIEEVGMKQKKKKKKFADVAL